MNKHKLAIFLVLCLTSVLLLTACHTNSDPWPASSGTSNTSTDTVQTNETVQSTDAPAPTDVPTDDTQTSDPSAPGLNG